jgi:glycine cleavage system T protein
MSETAERSSKTSILHAAQQELGAQFDISHGWEMAQVYTVPVEEHNAVRTTAGLIDLTFNGAIKVWGGEAVQFLNGLVSNNVKTLAPGSGMRAAFLTGHGKVRAIARVFNLGTEFLVITDPQTHEEVLKYISPFCYAGDFHVEDVSTQFRLLSLQGPKAHLVMKEISFQPVPQVPDYGWFQTLIAGHQAMVVQASHTGEEGFDLFLPESALPDVWDFVLLKGRFHSLVPVGFQALDSLRIEASEPVYGVDVDEANMLLELGLDDIVSFDKGCYTGQEAVAMATFRGHISKKLSGLRVDGATVPFRGDILKKNGKEIGTVTSALRSPTLNSVIALAYIKYGFFEVGNTLEIESKDAVLQASVVEIPFYRRVN